MKLLRIVVLGLAVFLAGSAARAEEWLTDHAAAVKAAEDQHKPIMLFFTGSDWCIWCKRLQAEVLNHDEFKQYAEKRLVLMEVDFPQAKSQPKDVKEQNQKLLDKYQVEGYPTCVIVDGAGKPLGTLGYMQGGPKPFLAKLDEILK